MRSIFKNILLFFESIVFAWQALRSNILRTTLSLLGVTIGIFSIVAVFTIVDALEAAMRKDMAFLGEDVMYVQRFPWGFGGSGEYPWWKYFRRPLNKIDEYRYLEKNLENADAVAVLLGKRGITAKYKNNSISSILLQGGSHSIEKVRGIEIAQGRFFTNQEIESGKEVCVIGYDIADALFPNESPIGKQIKVRGLNFIVAGVMKREGQNIFNDISNDQRLLISYKSFSKMFLVGNKGVEPTIAVKGRPEDPGMLALESELRGALRNLRGLKPEEEDNFALNRPELVAQAITSLFVILGKAGWFIGIFSILVGGFGIANIMFVSVKERTNIIGIQKSLGAKNAFILFQFLFEAIFLSMIGGGVGIGLVYLLTIIPQDFLRIFLTANNISLGLGVASIVGILAGVIPAWFASRLDPVEAIRAK